MLRFQSWTTTISLEWSVFKIFIYICMGMWVSAYMFPDMQCYFAPTEIKGLLQKLVPSSATWVPSIELKLSSLVVSAFACWQWSSASAPLSWPLTSSGSPCWNGAPSSCPQSLPCFSPPLDSRHILLTGSFLCSLALSFRPLLKQKS